MKWSEVAATAARLAPSLAAAIGGPLAGSAVAALEDVFGITPTPSAPIDQRLSTVAVALSGATSEQLMNVRKADQDYQVKMAEMGFKNIADARDMQKVTRSWVPAVLTMFITLGFFGMLLMLMFVKVPTDNAAVVYTFTGTLGTAWLGAIHFWFGDTQASADKTTIISKAEPVK